MKKLASLLNSKLALKKSVSALITSVFLMAQCLTLGPQALLAESVPAQYKGTSYLQTKNFTATETSTATGTQAGTQTTTESSVKTSTETSTGTASSTAVDNSTTHWMLANSKPVSSAPSMQGSDSHAALSQATPPAKVLPSALTNQPSADVSEVGVKLSIRTISQTEAEITVEGSEFNQAYNVYAQAAMGGSKDLIPIVEGLKATHGKAVYKISFTKDQLFYSAEGIEGWDGITTYHGQDGSTIIHYPLGPVSHRDANGALVGIDISGIKLPDISFGYGINRLVSNQSGVLVIMGQRDIGIDVKNQMINADGTFYPPAFNTMIKNSNMDPALKLENYKNDFYYTLRRFRDILLEMQHSTQTPESRAKFQNLIEVTELLMNILKPGEQFNMPSLF
ncbi:MAG: hypothetical protein EXS63_05925 [Candidatus Omnitrophica bacterium]|nr:hypothetical protein [Candidatus Omnitrophota bacterium]